MRNIRPASAQPRSACLLAMIGLVVLSGRVEAATVRFELPNYTVALGDSLDLRILIDYDQGEPDDLFSYGLRMDVLDLGGANLLSLDVPAALDYDGVNGAPAFMNLDPLVLGAKGTIDVFQAPQVPYTDSLLATYQMEFVEVGTVRLQLEPFNTLGPTEELFVSGDGVVMDDFIVFQETEVNVVPEPAAVLSLLVGLVAVTAGRRRQ